MRINSQRIENKNLSIHYNLMMDTTHGSGLIAFTLSPNPARYRSSDPCVQYEALLNCLFSKKILDYVFEDYVFMPELNTNGNVHIHGYYTLKDKVKYYKWFLPACKQWGHTLCKQGHVNDKWLDYCYKDLYLSLDIFEDLPVPLNKESRQEYSDCKEIRIKTTMRILKPKYKKHKRTITDYFK